MARRSRKQRAPQGGLSAALGGIHLHAAPILEQQPQHTIYNAAGYIRLSVEDNRNKGDSIETQKAILENFFASSLEIRLRDFYIDNGASGMTFTRPAFEKMLADAENGVINCIVVKDLSRLGRNAIDSGYYIEKYLPSLGVRFVAVNDDYDSANISDGCVGVMLPLKNVINEAYALDISRKVRAQQREAMKSGEFIGARPPFGYVKAADNCHRLVVDPAAAPVVRQIFEWAYEGAGINDIARRLNEAGFVTPSRYRQEQGIITNERLLGKGAWQTFTVNRILADEVYVGDMVQGKSRSVSRRQTPTDEKDWIRVSNTHEPIISREMFAAVQAKRRQAADDHAAKPKSPYSPNIYKGKIFCGYCGMPLHRQRQTRVKSDDFYIFHCLSNSRKARGSCEPYIMPEKELTATLLEMISRHAAAVLEKALRLRKPNGALERERMAASSELAGLRRESDKDGRMLKSLYENLASGLITPDEYRDMRSAYEAKMLENLSRTAELGNRLKELERQADDYCALSEMIKNALDSGITAELIDCLVGRIRVYHNRHIEVDFRFESGFDLMREVAANE